MGKKKIENFFTIVYAPCGGRKIFHHFIARHYIIPAR